MNSNRAQTIFAALYLIALFLGTGFINGLEMKWAAEEQARTVQAGR